MIPRNVSPGEQVSASIGFFDDDQNPRVAQSVLYPMYTVLDSNSNLITTGTGTLGTNNLWGCEFSIPLDAVLSENKYVITWLFIDNAGKEFISAEYFDVTSNYEVYAKETQLLALQNSSLQIFTALPKTTRPSVTIYSGDQVVLNDSASSAGVFNDTYLFKFTIPEYVLVDPEYSILWTQGLDQFYQKLNVITISTMLRVSDIRMYLDKVHKDLNMYVGYRDSDLCFHLNRGLDLINSFKPITNWSLLGFSAGGPQQLASYGLTAAACYSALNAQYLAEGDLAFDYSGQPVQLSVDRTQYIESQIGRLWDYLTTEFKPFKIQFCNQDMPFHLSTSYPSVSNNFNTMQQVNLGIPIHQIR